MNLIHLLQHERLIHSIKTALACLAGFIIAKYLPFRTDQWIIITILVVMCAQINVGSMIQKSYMRFLGTLAGSAIAITTLVIFGDNRDAIIVAVLLSAILFSFIATSNKSFSESGTLGVVTVAIILIGQNPNWLSGIERCAEISLGILIAALISQFVLPVHARDHLRRNQATTIRKLRTFYKTIFTHHLSSKQGNELRNLDEELAKSLIAQRKLAGEAKREHFGKLFSLDYFQESLWLEKEILRSVIFMYHAYHATDESIAMLREMETVQEFHRGISESLDKIAQCIEKQRIETILVPNIGPLKHALQEKIAEVNAEEKTHLDGFLFCAEILVARLNKLAALINVV